MASITCAFSPTNAIQKPSTKPFHHLSSFLSSAFKKPMLREFRHNPMYNQVIESVKMASANLLDGIANSMFKFVDQPMTSQSQGNYAPVNEIGEAVEVSVIEGEVPDDFPQGVYIRTGSNPYFADKITAVSPLGEVAFSWFEGDGMVHATYFNKEKEGGWSLSYKNKYIEAETFLMEKERNKVLFLPTTQGQPSAVLLAFLLNMLRFGRAFKDYNNTNVFEHAGKVYTITESHLPHEIDISSLETTSVWDVGGAWHGAFTSHPKTAPDSEEMVTMRADVNKPHYVLGVISGVVELAIRIIFSYTIFANQADGKKLVHEADLKFRKSILAHELGITENYNVIMDNPIRIGLDRLFADNSFIGYDRSGKSRIGVMPRYGDAESIFWFDVKNHCSFHLINSFEDGDEVVVRGCRTPGTIIPGPDHKVDKAKWYKRAYMKPPPEDEEGFDPYIDGVLFSRPYEWRLDMNTGRVREGFLTKPDIAMDFPAINNKYVGRKNKYSYAQVVDSVKTANTGMTIYNMFAKLHFDEKGTENENFINVEYHVLQDDHFCSGLQFVQNPNGIDEDDGWVICYVHDENTNVSEVYIVDAKNFTGKPVAKIKLPQRVPYGYHGIFVCK